MDFAAIPRPAFGTAAQHLPTVRTKPNKRRQAEARTAAAMLAEVPSKPGESSHCLMTGEYDLGAVIVAVANETPCERLRIATLGYGKRNAVGLVGLLETKAVGTLTLLVSNFFHGHEKELHAWTREELSRYPGSRTAVARSHCKIVTFDFGDGGKLVFEGSANLRTNGNIENITMTRHRGLHDFYAAWIDDLVAKHHGKETEQKSGPETEETDKDK